VKIQNTKAQHKKVQHNNCTIQKEDN